MHPLSAGGPISAGVHLRTASCLMVLGVHVFGVYGFRDYDHRVLVVDPATPLSCKPWWFEFFNLRSTVDVLNSGPWSRGQGKRPDNLGFISLKLPQPLFCRLLLQTIQTIIEDFPGPYMVVQGSPLGWGFFTDIVVQSTPRILSYEARCQTLGRALMIRMGFWVICYKRVTTRKTKASYH